MSDPAVLRITETFLSLQGETNTVGLPTVFVRLTGCPLRCGYCDTEYAFKGGEKKSISEILETVQSYNVQHVTVTGGEPLAQKSCLDLLTQLCDAGFIVSIETSGALDISRIDPRVVIVMDLKTPDSTEESKNLLTNIDYLKPHHQVKFVICSENDYLWSKNILNKYQLSDRCEVLFSPSFHDIKPVQLADWILRDRLPVRFQLQLHKILWNDEPGR